MAVLNPADLMRQATDVAGVCRDIVSKTAIRIRGKKYVKVEGWESIATAYGCIAGARDVQITPEGYMAIGELRKISDGTLIATAEGFVGKDEYTWFGGEDPGGKKYSPRPMYAIRAMAQTRAISRVCRSAFAHVVVLIDENLSTTPAEEVPYGGFQDSAEEIEQRQEQREAQQEEAPKGVVEVSDPSDIDKINMELNLQSQHRKKHGNSKKPAGV